MSLDQPDNADRVKHLGVGLCISQGRFTVERALPLLRRCLEDEKLRESAGEHAGRLHDRPSPDVLLDWLEKRMRSTHPSRIPAAHTRDHP
jgi:UDP:flavonoid glycosyltransferase YjiC (YdhE family)